MTNNTTKPAWQSPALKRLDVTETMSGPTVFLAESVYDAQHPQAGEPFTRAS